MIFDDSSDDDFQTAADGFEGDVGRRAVGEDGEEENPVVPDSVCKAVATVKSEGTHVAVLHSNLRSIIVTQLSIRIIKDRCRNANVEYHRQSNGHMKLLSCRHHSPACRFRVFLGLIQTREYLKGGMDDGSTDIHLLSQNHCDNK